MEQKNNVGSTEPSSYINTDRVSNYDYLGVSTSLDIGGIEG